jgi:hypothetical protein
LLRAVECSRYSRRAMAGAPQAWPGCLQGHLAGRDWCSRGRRGTGRSGFTVPVAFRCKPRHMLGQPAFAIQHYDFRTFSRRVQSASLMACVRQHCLPLLSLCRGGRTAKAIVDVVLDSYTDSHVTILETKSDLSDFVKSASNNQKPAVVLLSQKSEVTSLYRSLSTQLKGRMAFAQVCMDTWRGFSSWSGVQVCPEALNCWQGRRPLQTQPL